MGFYGDFMGFEFKKWDFMGFELKKNVFYGDFISPKKCGGSMNWPIGLRPGLGLTMITWESMSRMWIWAIKNSVWLVVWTIFFVYFSHHIVNFIIPTDVQSIIFRGFAQNHQPEKPFFLHSKSWVVDPAIVKKRMSQ